MILVFFIGVAVGVIATLGIGYGLYTADRKAVTIDVAALAKAAETDLASAAKGVVALASKELKAL